MGAIMYMICERNHYSWTETPFLSAKGYLDVKSRESGWRERMHLFVRAELNVRSTEFGPYDVVA